MSSIFFKTILIGTIAILAGGCQLINPKVNPAKPTPSPTASPTSTPLSLQIPEITDTTVATESAAATESAKPNTTKGGITTPKNTGSVKGATTTKTTTKTTTVKSTSLMDTSFDSLEVTNFPGQELEKELTLYNKSDKRVLFSARAADAATENNPVRVNSSYEATGNIAANSSSTIKIKVMSRDQNPNFNTSITINFISESQQIIATKTVKVTAHTPIGDRVTLETHTDGDTTGNASKDITYGANKAYPIRLVNRHSYLVKWSARFLSSEADGRLVISAKSGEIGPGSFWDTDVHFTDKDPGNMTQAILEFTFNRENGDSKETKTITLNVKR